MDLLITAFNIKQADIKNTLGLRLSCLTLAYTTIVKNFNFNNKDGAFGLNVGFL